MSELKYANTEISGFGSHSAAEVEQLQKALGLGGQGGNAIGIGEAGTPSGAEAGYAIQTPGDFRQGSALAVEDLDRTLKLVTFGLEHLRLWKDILKERVPQVVHEYNVQNAYGISDASPFFEMGATPVETDAQYARDVVQIKYLGTKGAVLHNLTLIQAAHGPVVAREVKNKTIELLARNERAMFDASSLFSAGQEYDGLDLQIVSKAGNSIYQSEAFVGYGNTSATHLLDAGGADFDEDLAEDAALIAVNNFGMPMDMYLGTDVHSAFSRAFYAKQRTVPGESLTSGNRVTEHMGTLDYRFKPSLFNRPKKMANPRAAVTSTVSGVVSSVGDSGEVIAFGGITLHAVTASGEGAAATATGVNGNSIVLTLTAVTGETILYVNAYRGGLFLKRLRAITGIQGFLAEENYLIGANSGVNGAAAQINLNREAGSAKAYLIMHDPDVLCWKQLGSMIKYDLAVTTTQYEWLQLLYGTPLVMAPLKNVIVRNIKSDS